MPIDYIDFVTISTKNCWDKTKKTPGRPTTTADQFGKQTDKLKKKNNNPPTKIPRNQLQTGYAYFKVFWNKYNSTIYKLLLTCSICSATNISIYMLFSYIYIYIHNTCQP